MNALTLLKEDHDKVKKLLEQGESTTERAVKTREELFDKIKGELKVHEAIEEEVLYPALREFAATKEIVLEAFEEHHVVDVIVGELEATPVDDEAWAAKFTVMKENLEHHIEEEDDEMFKQARKVMDESELDELAWPPGSRSSQGRRIGPQRKQAGPPRTRGGDGAYGLCHLRDGGRGRHQARGSG